MATIYGYVRFSSTAQIDGESLDTQSRHIESYAVSKGWEVAHECIYVEAGVSGGTDFQDRPMGQNLLSVL
jgi:DNA invertase Pin-like site-specific DNA recombinase